MNELIEELWKKLRECSPELLDEFGDNYYIEFVNAHAFKQAIQTACKAQRNACAGAVECIVSTQVVDKIKNAEIESQDYENISN